MFQLAKEQNGRRVVETGLGVKAMMKDIHTGFKIITVTLLAGISFSFTSPPVALADSTVEGTVTNNPVKVQNGANIAAGINNKASHSSVAIKNSRIGGHVANSVKSKNTVNVAVGKKNTASQGAVVISRSSVKGAVTNDVVMNKATNMAMGKNNRAHQGSVRIDNSQVKGKVHNSAVIKKSANLAVGQNNAASQASVLVTGAGVRGKIVNDASISNSVNAAEGFGNEAHQSSIVIDGSGLPILPGNALSSRGEDDGVVNLLSGQQLSPSKGGKPVETKIEKASGEEVAAKPQPQYVPGQVVFLVANDAQGQASLERVAKKFGLNVSEKTVLKSLNRIMVVSATDEDAGKIAKALEKENGVYSSQPNYIFSTMGREDPLSSMQNIVSMLDLHAVHQRVSGKNVTVAVVDTGVALDHQDLQSRIVGFQNFVPDSSYQGEIHGTAVAGIIGAGKNQFGIVGIAPDVSLLALRACRQVSETSSAGECFSTSLVQSLDAAIAAGVDIANLSLGALVRDTLLGMVIDAGAEAGVVFTAPVGNDPAAEKIAFPAAHRKVISIAGLDESGKPLPNRRLASMADAVAPASNLFVTTPGNKYNFIDGTSFASASISGIIALSLEKKNTLNPHCLPNFNSGVSWSEQVYACVGF